jgi:hypothetical protein
MNSELESIIECTKCNIVFDKECKQHNISKTIKRIKNDVEFSIMDVLKIIKVLINFFLLIYFCILVDKLTDKVK